MMAGSFRRAQLRGSDELFRPTSPDTGEAAALRTGTAPEAPVIRETNGESAPAKPDGRLVRLTDDELGVLASAVQHLRYPTSTRPPTKPGMDEFERLGHLRQRLLDIIEEPI